MKPDLVIAEKEQITDVFELKFKPHYKVERKDLETDIQKLPQYGARSPVRLKPNTGQWREELPVRDDCRLHFVAVARHAWANNDVAAVWPKSLRGVVRALKEEDPQLRESNTRVLSHWFGRVGGHTDERRGWSIEFGIR